MPTPARLKFLRSDRAESQAIADTLRKLAMAEPFVGFTLYDTDGGREILRVDAEQGELFDALGARLTRLMGRDFVDNAIRVDTERDGFRLSGLLPPCRPIRAARRLPSTSMSTAARCATSC